MTRESTKGGSTTVLLGVVVALVARAWASSGPAYDANIGAGLLLLLGAALVVAGLVQVLWAVIGWLWSVLRSGA